MISPGWVNSLRSQSNAEYDSKIRISSLLSKKVFSAARQTQACERGRIKRTEQKKPKAAEYSDLLIIGRRKPQQLCGRSIHK